MQNRVTSYHLFYLALLLIFPLLRPCYAVSAPSLEEGAAIVVHPMMDMTTDEEIGEIAEVLAGTKNTKSSFDTSTTEVSSKRNEIQSYSIAHPESSSSTSLPATVSGKESRSQAMHYDNERALMITLKNSLNIDTTPLEAELEISSSFKNKEQLFEQTCRQRSLNLRELAEGGNLELAREWMGSLSANKYIFFNTNPTLTAKLLAADAWNKAADGCQLFLANRNSFIQSAFDSSVGLVICSSKLEVAQKKLNSLQQVTTMMVCAAKNILTYQKFILEEATKDVQSPVLGHWKDAFWQNSYIVDYEVNYTRSILTSSPSSDYWFQAIKDADIARQNSVTAARLQAEGRISDASLLVDRVIRFNEARDYNAQVAEAIEQPINSTQIDQLIEQAKNAQKIAEACQVTDYPY